MRRLPKPPPWRPRERHAPALAAALLAVAVCSALASGCDSDPTVDTRTAYEGETEPLDGDPFAARRVVAIGPADAVLFGTTGNDGGEDCDAELAAAWLDSGGEIDRAVRIPYEDCARSVDGAEVGGNGRITVSSWIYHPSSGGFEDNSSQSPVLARLRADGSLDAAFAGGIVRTSASGFALRSDGSVVTTDGRHYLNNGQIDRRFGGGGQAARVFDSTFAGGIATWPDDSFAVISLVRETAEDIALQRFVADGTIDRGFGVAGLAKSDIDPRYEGSYDTQVGPLLRTPDRGLLTLASYAPGQVVYGRFALLKFGADGELDPGFGRRGRVAISPASGSLNRLEPTHLTLQRDGRPLVVAQIGLDEQLVLRYLPDGRPDPSFGNDGRVDLSIGSGVATNVVQLGDGRLLGAVRSKSGASTAFRLRSDGRLDRSFGEQGTVRVRP